jgi:trypsin-like peptidase/effector-associated domain 1 (EAD1)-containing protein
MSTSVPPTIDFHAANGRQLGLIRTTFLAVFVRDAKLAMFLSERLEKNFDAIAEGKDFEERIFNLLRDAQAEGWLAELVTKTFEVYARAPALKNMIDQWFLFADARGANAAAVPATVPSASATDLPAPTPRAPSASEGIKRGPRPAVTNPSEIEYVMSELREPEEAQRWLDQLAAIRRRVCRVSFVDPDRDQGMEGTGFLIGPDLVLTANFVASPPKKTIPRACHVDFDFEIADGQIKLGSRIAVSEIVFGPDGERVNLDCLTYAILRLGSREGDTSRGGAARGWFDLKNVRAEFHPGEVLFLLHYPLAGPLHLSEGKLIAADFPYRLRYEADTAGGSSGAPIFDRHFRLVGLHERRLRSEWDFPPQFRNPDRLLEVGNKLGLRADSIAVALRAQDRLPPPWTPPSIEGVGLE